MKLKDFKKEYDGAPVELKDFAEIAKKLEDCLDLVIAADRYLAMLRGFEEALKKYGIVVE